MRRCPSKSKNFFSPSVDYVHLAGLALAAYKVGKIDEARLLARFAAFKMPTDKKARDPSVEKLLEALEKLPQ